MNNQDLRVVKTRASIKETFLEMLKKTPIEKISVTELSRQAQINKGTFYLHYQDIYALYNEVRDEFLQQMIQSMDYCSLMLSDPEEFLKDFFDTLRINAESIDFLWPKHDIILFQPNLNERITRKICDDCGMEKSVRNMMALNILVDSVFRFAFEYLEKEPEITMEILLDIIRTFFGDAGDK